MLHTHLHLHDPLTRIRDESWKPSKEQCSSENLWIEQYTKPSLQRAHCPVTPYIRGTEVRYAINIFIF